ncbi:flavin monoamine oxidase family protein [Collimonas antrihumi]|uniref:flavin monoamine oxidase family protein n=1 Tax=Collimonas antrihumi TaxID=1940615 RepID=UPI001B8C1FEA|nr:FAD-dependent oxidoreductase [Collimonas antrihumi]
MAWFPSLDALGGTSGKRPRAAGPLTLAQLKAGTSRLIESFPYDYGRILAASDTTNGWLREPFSNDEKTNKVIIVGCGMSGLMAARELLRAGLSVDMYDRNKLKEQTGDWMHYRHGRANTDIRDFGLKGQSVCELGGMRFPVKAKATWHMFAEAFRDDQVFMPFPNPGIVPTIVCEDGQTYLWHAGSASHPDLPPQFGRIAGHVAEAMNTLSDGQTTSIEVQGLLVLPDLNPAQEKRLYDYWGFMVSNFDNMTFGAWIHEYVAKPNNWSPDDLARFFNLGFGTGGMGSLFPVSFLEMLRIWIWDYADEYALPAGYGLGSVANIIMEKLNSEFGAAGKGTLRIFEEHEVQEIGMFSAADETLAKSGVLVRDLNITAAPNLQPQYADFLIVAVPHTAAIALMSLTADHSYPRNTTRVIQNIEGKPCQFYSYFDKPSTSPAFNTFIRPQKNGIARLNMVNASKSFCTFETAPWNVTTPEIAWHRIEGLPVQCVLSEGWSRASYFLPANPEDINSPCAALLSYTWNLDSNKVQAVSGAAKARENPGTDGHAEPAPWLANSNQWWRAYRTAASVLPYAFINRDGGNVTRFFIDSGSTTNNDVTGMDWQDNPSTAGGFKLDAAGDFQMVNTWAYAYLLTEENGFASESTRWKTYQRIHFASDSASNYGGWCEGAFMAGANAAIGVLATINRIKLKDEPAEILEGNPFADINQLIPLKQYPIVRESGKKVA